MAEERPPSQPTAGEVARLQRRVAALEAQLDQQARAHAARLHLVLEAGELGICDVDLQHNTVIWNAHSGAICGVPVGTPMSLRQATRLIHAADRGPALRAFQAARAPGAEGKYRLEMRMVRPDGEIRWVEVRGQVLFAGEADERRAIYFIGTLADITPRKETEAKLQAQTQELAQKNQQLRALKETLEHHVAARTQELATYAAALEQQHQRVRRLASSLALAEQRERHRIAQVLHDHLQQVLYGVQMRIQEVHDRSPTEQSQALADLDVLVLEALQTTRRLTVDLSPPVLNSEGLPVALEWLAHQMAALHKLQVTVHAPAAFELLPMAVRVLLFQIVRELLFNVVKHAGTNQAAVTLHQTAAQVTVTVTDTGRGFAVSETCAQAEDLHTGLGLQSIQERLSLFDGHMALHSQPGAGTRVTVTLPRAQKPAGTAVS